MQARARQASIILRYHAIIEMKPFCVSTLQVSPIMPSITAASRSWSYTTMFCVRVAPVCNVAGLQATGLRECRDAR